MTVSKPTAISKFVHPDEAWLAKQPGEPIVDPEIPIVDAHQHLWDRPGSRYLVDEFAADVATGHNVVATVYVECRSGYRTDGPEALRPVGETEYIAGLTAKSAAGASGRTRIAAGIVAFVDLTLGDRVEPVIEGHAKAGGGRFCGVRQMAGWDASNAVGNNHGVPGPHLLQHPQFQAGVRRLAAASVTFDALVFHPQLGDAVALARAVPDVHIALNHLGAPLGSGPYAGRAEEVFTSWKASMAELARCPNVFVKLGGMLIRLAAIDFQTLDAPPSSAELAACWRRYILTCIELFGASRCMFESNFPVEKMGTGWATLWNAYKRIVEGASAEEKLALFGGTARRAYRLK